MIFISYKSEDISIAQKVKASLESSGISCWMAPYSIPVGENYATSVPEAIEKCDAFVIILTQKALCSIYVPKELDRAIANKKKIYPIKYEDVKFSKDFEFYLCNIQVLDIRENDFSNVLERIKQIDNKRVEKPWGPERKTYLWDERADQVVFNSIINNPTWGDERNFVRIRKISENEIFSSKIKISPGEEYEIQIFYHNNASCKMNSSGEGIAQSVHLRAQYPKYLKKGQIGQLTAFISSSNSIHKQIWDSCFFKAECDMYIDYVANSAVLHNDGGTSNNLPISKQLIDDGVYIGYWKDLMGTLPAGDKFSGSLTFRIKALSADFVVISEVSRDAITWHKKINASPGETLKMRLSFINIGTLELTGVTGHDDLSEGLRYRQGSTFAYSSRHPDATKSPDTIDSSGLGVGAIIPQEEVVVTYEVEVDIGLKQGTLLCNNAYFACHQGKRFDKVVIQIN